jgi:hypothetical protein
VSYSGANAYTATVDGYDANGNGLGTTVTIPASEGVLAGAYDTTTPSYNSAGQVLSIGYPAVGTGSSALHAETVATGYNSAGSPTTLSSSLATYATDSWTNYGPLAGRTYGTGSLTATRTYSWNATTGWLDKIQTDTSNEPSGTHVQSDSYYYDDAGNVKVVASAGGGAAIQQQCFSYDKLNRLTAAYTNTNTNGQSVEDPPGDVSACSNQADAGGISPYNLAYGYDSKGLGTLRPSPTT